MKTHRLGLLAAAIAAVALVGCDDDSADSLGSVKITEDNQEAVAEAGFDLAQGGLDISSEFGPGSLDLSGAAAVGGGSLPKLARTLQRHLQAGEIAALTSPELPTGVTLVEEGTVECETSGSYTYLNTASAWGVTYDNCVEEYSEEGYADRYEYNGSVTGQYTNPAGYGGWDATYERLRSKFVAEYDQTDYVGTYTAEYEISGAFSFYEDVGSYGGAVPTAARTAGPASVGGTYRIYNYQAEDLKSTYRFKSTGDVADGMIPRDRGYEEDGAGTVVYDEYDFAYFSYGGRDYWDGELIARDSENGIWSVIANDFGTSYCNNVIGNLRFTGRVDDEGASTGGNVLVITGNGTNATVTYDLFEADGETEISSTDVNWFGTACEV